MEFTMSHQLPRKTVPIGSESRIRVVPLLLSIDSGRWMASNQTVRRITLMAFEIHTVQIILRIAPVAT